MPQCISGFVNHDYCVEHYVTSDISQYQIPYFRSFTWILITPLNPISTVRIQVERYMKYRGCLQFLAAIQHDYVICIYHVVVARSERSLPVHGNQGKQIK